MTALRCGRIPLETLIDYAAGDLPDAEAAAVEEHLFSCADCAARAAELDAVARGVRAATLAGEIGGFVTDAVLNQLARDGVRIRMFTLSPGAIVPCAVWEGDELMALRLRGDFGGASEVTLAQRVGEAEVSRETSSVIASPGEIIYATPASWVRRLPAGELQLQLSAQEGGRERAIGSYTLVHGGSLHRQRADLPS